MPAEGWVRAADMDREETVEILRRAAAEGRLDPLELEARTDTAYLAQTIGELRELIADVPPGAPATGLLPTVSPDVASAPRWRAARRRRVSLLLLGGMVACVVIGAAARDTAVIALGLAAGVAAAVLRRWGWRR